MNFHEFLLMSTNVFENVTINLSLLTFGCLKIKKGHHGDDEEVPHLNLLEIMEKVCVTATNIHFWTDIFSPRSNHSILFNFWSSRFVC